MRDEGTAGVRGRHVNEHADEEDEGICAQANEEITPEGWFAHPRVTVRYRHDTLVVPAEQVDYVDVSPKQVVSIATAMIPFLENDDANRALMGANMQRQAVPLLRTQAPLVGTGMEYRAACDSGVVILAKSDGVIERVSALEIGLRCDDGRLETYRMTKFMRSNQGTCINQKPIVRKDERVVRAMLSVERHCFVDSGLMGQAYVDTSLPIGLQQTISKPSVVARMSELLLQSPAMQQQGAQAKLGRILEIGTGCGYQASVLSHIAAEVYSIERLKGLHEKAIANLRPFRVPNIHLILGDGMQGFAAGAPYAGIIAAAGGEAIPQAWVDQLAMGGRIVAPMAAGNGHQVLVVIDKTPNGLQQSVLEAVLFVPLKSGLA